MRDPAPADGVPALLHAPCPVCGGRFRPDSPDWLRVCDDCGLPGMLPLPDTPPAAVIDEPERAAALRALRQASFARTLDALVAARRGAGGRLLDVGCAHGWFLAAARQRGFDTLGIEPDAAMVAVARGQGLAVRDGRFPDAVEAGERFDVIAFNDVLEHLPDPPAALAACRDLLEPDGVIVVALPLRTGIFYRLARGLARLGMPGPLERLWQRAFPSPHRLYFDRPGFDRLCAGLGFTIERAWRVPPVTLSGLWPRLRFDRGRSLASCALLWIAIAPLLPLLPLLPPDTVTFVLRATARAARPGGARP